MPHELLSGGQSHPYYRRLSRGDDGHCSHSARREQADLKHMQLLAAVCGAVQIDRAVHYEANCRKIARDFRGGDPVKKTPVIELCVE